jgi:hypothetical protein
MEIYLNASYIPLGVLNVHAPTEDKSDDTEGSSYYELMTWIRTLPEEQHESVASLGLHELLIVMGLKLTTHLHVSPRSRMSGAIPPLPIRLHGVVLS